MLEEVPTVQATAITEVLHILLLKEVQAVASTDPVVLRLEVLVLSQTKEVHQVQEEDKIA